MVCFNTSSFIHTPGLVVIRLRPQTASPFGIAMTTKYSLLYCLAPVINLSHLFGLMPGRVVTEKGKLILQFKTYHLWYSVFICLLLAFFFQWGVIDLIKMDTWRKLDLLSSLAAFGQIYGLFFVALTDIITGWLNRWRVAAVIRKIDMVDQHLSTLPIGINYKSARRKLVVQLIALFVVPVGASMVNCFVINQKTKFSFLCYFFICFLPILVISLKEFQFYNSILLIRQKLRLVNQHLLRLSQVDLNVESSFEDTSHSNKIAVISQDTKSIEGSTKILQNLARMHSDLMDILKEIQFIFGPHLLASILTAFGIITTQLYYLFSGIVQELHYNILMTIMTTSWVAIQWLLIMVNVVVCAKMSNTVGFPSYFFSLKINKQRFNIFQITETGVVLHNISACAEDSKLFRVVQLFSLQIIHRKCEFTAAGFIKLDYKFVTSVSYPAHTLLEKSLFKHSFHLHFR